MTQTKQTGFLQQIAGTCARSFLFKKGRRLWETNSTDWNCPLSKLDKLRCGSYLILSDYAAGVFPPQFTDQAKAYDNEINYNASLPGFDLAAAQKSHALKPFWGEKACEKYLGAFHRVYAILLKRGINPGRRLLELGCGSGWMAEFLAAAGFSVVGTTISHYDISVANQKAEAHKCRGVDSELKFFAKPMESVNEIPDSDRTFDAVYVFEALHHAYSWTRALEAAAATLKKGGWLILANEPNRLHTCISYRVAKLARTHEIGFSRRQLLLGLKQSGYTGIEVLQPRLDNWVKPFWIVARKG